jgi:hypothetical protein
MVGLAVALLSAFTWDHRQMDGWCRCDRRRILC